MFQRFQNYRIIQELAGYITISTGVLTDEDGSTVVLLFRLMQFESVFN